MPRNSKTVAFPAVREESPPVNSQVEQPVDVRLQSLLKHVFEDLRKTLVSNEDQIISDIERIEDEAEDDKDSKFKIGISASINLKTKGVDTAISYSIKVADKRSHSGTEDDGTRDMFNENPE